MKNAFYEISDEEEAEIQRMIASDPDAPEATAEQLAAMRPFKEVFPDLYASMQREFIVKAQEPTRKVSLQLDQDVIAKFKATGKGWQSRINEILKNAEV